MLVLPLLVAVAVQVLIALGLFAWARWVGRRRASVWWGRAAWLPLVALCLSLIGLCWSTVYIVRAFGAVADADPSQKATLLAANISEAMNCTALFAIPAWLLYLASLVASTVGSIMRPRV